MRAPSYWDGQGFDTSCHQCDRMGWEIEHGDHEVMCSAPVVSLPIPAPQPSPPRAAKPTAPATLTQVATQQGVSPLSLLLGDIG